MSNIAKKLLEAEPLRVEIGGRTVLIDPSTGKEIKTPEQERSLPLGSPWKFYVSASGNPYYSAFSSELGRGVAEEEIPVLCPFDGTDLSEHKVKEDVQSWGFSCPQCKNRFYVKRSLYGHKKLKGLSGKRETPFKKRRSERG